MSEMKKKQGERLKAFRIYAGFTRNQKGFGRILSMAQGTYSALENGVTSISYSVMCSLTKGFPELNINWILTGNGPMILPNDFREKGFQPNLILLAPRTPKERLIHYLNYRNFSTPQFYISTGLPKGFLSRGHRISTKSLEILTAVFPDLNIHWLTTGKGTMIFEDQESLALEYQQIKKMLRIILKELNIEGWE